MIALTLALALVAGADTSAAYAATAVAHHRRADAFERKGDLDSAISEMRELVSAPAADDRRARDLRLDAFGRLAELFSKAHKPGEAESSARRGISEAKEESALVARLWVALGDALEAQGKEDAALDAYARAIQIGRRIIDRAIADGGTK